MGPAGRALLIAVSVLAVALVALGVGASVLRTTEPSRQDVVAARGTAVMLFDLDATEHIFEKTPTGGVQSVVALDPDDGGQVALIREHLSEEADRFSAGDFDDPARIHGHDMPGLEELVEHDGRLTLTYRDLPAGGELTYRADTPTLVAAVHAFFDAQVHDHGDHARPG